MRRESKAERAAWTAHVEGTAAPKENKYHAQKEGKYASKHEANIAAQLGALERSGDISELQEQRRIVLLPGNGRLRPIVYIADFSYRDREGFEHIADAKGFKTPVYRLKKRILKLLHDIDIEEV
jgi:hypothetical protein